MTAAELTEIRQLFRAKLHQQERPRARRNRLSSARRARNRVETVTSPPRDDEVLASRDVARLLGVHPKTVTPWANGDGLPAFAPSEDIPATDGLTFAHGLPRDDSE